MSHDRLVHHELCFGCGRTNLFGLLMELERVDDHRVRGRGFVKQDHQGADRGTAHEGVILTALSEAMAMACGREMRAAEVELHLETGVPVGSFLDVEAEAGEETGRGRRATAAARVNDELVATAQGTYAPH